MSNIGRLVHFTKDQAPYAGRIVRETTKKGKARFIVDCDGVEINIPVQFARFQDGAVQGSNIGYVTHSASYLRELARAGGDATLLRR